MMECCTECAEKRRQKWTFICQLGRRIWSLSTKYCDVYGLFKDVAETWQQISAVIHCEYEGLHLQEYKSLTISTVSILTVNFRWSLNKSATNRKSAKMKATEKGTWTSWKQNCETCAFFTKLLVVLLLLLLLLLLLMAVYDLSGFSLCQCDFTPSPVWLQPPAVQW